MTLDGDDDEVVGMICMPESTVNDVMVLSERGYGKRTPLDTEITNEEGVTEKVPVYRVTNRGGKGVRTMNITEKTGRLVAIESVNDENDLVIINKSGITLRIHVADIRVQGRATQGVRIINLEKRNDTIASVCCVDSDPEEEVEQVEAQELMPEMPEEEIVDIEEPEEDEAVDDDEITDELSEEDEE